MPPFAFIAEPKAKDAWTGSFITQHSAKGILKVWLKKITEQGWPHGSTVKMNNDVVGSDPAEQKKKLGYSSKVLAMVQKVAALKGVGRKNTFAWKREKEERKNSIETRKRVSSSLSLSLSPSLPLSLSFFFYDDDDSDQFPFSEAALFRRHLVTPMWQILEWHLWKSLVSRTNLT